MFIHMSTYGVTLTRRSLSINLHSLRVFFAPVAQPLMIPRGLTFIESRAPRAAGLSEKALDEHKELIGDLYLSQNLSRGQVIQHLKANRGFSIS